MNKLKLKFNHDYEKLPINWEDTQAILIGVVFIPDMKRLKLRLPQLIRETITFQGEEGSYSKGILLTLFHLNSSRIFTTIRRYTKDKYQYYEKTAGKLFELMRVHEYMED